MKMKIVLTKDKNSDRITRFKSLKIVENRLVLVNKDEEIYNILFSELDRIYIRKRQFNVFYKLGIFAISLFLLSILNNYMLIEIVLFVAVFLFLPLFAWTIDYKWYQLNILHQNGTFYMKTFYKKEKQEQISLVNVVKKEVFDTSNRINFRDNERVVN